MLYRLQDMLICPLVCLKRETVVHIFIRFFRHLEQGSTSMCTWNPRNLPISARACFVVEINCEPPFFISHFKTSFTVPQDMTVLGPMPDFTDLPDNVGAYFH
jgi:hypothetical protein